MFEYVTVERAKQDLSSPTDIEVSIQLKKIDVLPGSVLELIIPRQHLDLDGVGKGTCRLTSHNTSPWFNCQVDYDSNRNYRLRTDAII